MSVLSKVERDARRRGARSARASPLPLGLVHLHLGDRLDHREELRVQPGAELLRSLGNPRIESYCLAAFEGKNGGWLGHFERDTIEEELAALDGATD